MSLLENAYESCTMLDKAKVPDGAGGIINSYTDGIDFMAAVTLDSSMQARIGMAQGVKNVYTVTTGREITLEFHDAFRRNRDGKIFRVTSDGNDKLTPATSSLNMRQVSAEEWSLPNDR